MATGRYLRRLSFLYTTKSGIFSKYAEYSLNKNFIKTWSPLLGSAVRIVMPSLSPTMAEGTIVKWHKKEGDGIKAGDVLCDIQTDKAVMSLETEEEGTLAKILKPDNSAGVKVGTLIALISERGDDWRKVTVPVDIDSSSKKAEQSNTPSDKATVASHNTSLHGIGPAVRALLDVYGLQPTDIKSSGPHGALLKGDILQHVKTKNLQPKQQPSPESKSTSLDQNVPVSPTQVPTSASQKTSPSLSAAYTDVPLTNIRSIIARRLLESKISIPHSYTTIDCQMDELLKLRNNMTSQGQKASVNDYIVKAVAVTLQRVPEVNAFWGKDEQIHFLSNIDISVAVATDKGLITPIVKNACHLSVMDISNTTRSLAAKARENKLKPEEFQGGTFTISNLGMYGVVEFTAIINPPQSCILAVGASRLELNSNGTPVTLMNVTMSSDARVVDDYTAAKFLETLKQVIESPLLTLVSKAESSPHIRQTTYS